MHRPHALPIATLSILLLLGACGSAADQAGTAASPGPTGSTIPPALAELGPQVLTTSAAVTADLYDAALSQAESMATAVHAFLDAPDATTLAAARQAWLDARPAYLHTEGLRFSQGPIDSGDNLEGFINAWPLDEVYIDSILTGAGPITAATLRADNERGGERNISTGWHAVEYLLWGVDDDPNGPGDRPAADFAVGHPSTASIREYLAVVTDMLVEDLHAVADAWAPGSSYPTNLIALLPADGLRRVLTGIGTLSGGELYGQRMSVPYETKDQEEEHSCFSDNTTEDHRGDVDSIRRIYLALGAGDSPLGPSLSDLVAQVDPALDQRVRDAIDAAVTATAAIPRPFDQAFLGPDSAPGRRAIAAALSAVDAMTGALVDVGLLLGIQIGTAVP